MKGLMKISLIVAFVSLLSFDITNCRAYDRSRQGGCCKNKKMKSMKKSKKGSCNTCGSEKGCCGCKKKSYDK